ncbi:MAG: hypothetical protein BGO69_10455 [Bacteroidetes bacterium 46-16]|nr:MAG: hypothetical protein BGO69_10455 [Bacteroidetes bacterium 46-16]
MPDGKAKSGTNRASGILITPALSMLYLRSMPDYCFHARFGHESQSQAGARMRQYLETAGKSGNDRKLLKICYELFINQLQRFHLPNRK